jgi:hypothetical protein
MSSFKLDAHSTSTETLVVCEFCTRQASSRTRSSGTSPSEFIREDILVGNDPLIEPFCGLCRFLVVNGVPTKRYGPQESPLAFKGDIEAALAS